VRHIFPERLIIIDDAISVDGGETMSQRVHSRNGYFKNILIKIVVITLVFMSGNFAQGSPKLAEAVEVGIVLSGMTVDPDGMLFDIGNMAPGDKVTERLTVKNHEYSSFKYSLSSSITDESVDSVFFFNNLNLVIKEVRFGSIKYEGKLKDFETINFGWMLPKGQRDFDCTLEFPAESGNEYQRLTTSFKFVVSAEQEKRDPPNPPNPPNPQIIVPPGVVPPVPDAPVEAASISLPSIPLIIGLPDTGGIQFSIQAEH